MEPFRVWFFTDGRLGHRNQLRGLAQCLAARVATECHWLDVTAQGFRMTEQAGLAAQFGAQQLPHWLIGAGSACQWPMIWTRALTGVNSLILMKPSWPLWLFDAACIPAHDKPPPFDRILVTQGVLNTMVPVVAGRDPRRGLILMGGPGRHFVWDEAALLAQVRAIVDAAPEVQWRLSDSPRTPPELLPKLAAWAPANVLTTAYAEVDENWLQTQLSEVGRVWVSCDSVSMVYESITAGAPTGLLQLPPARQSRLTRSMKQLVAAGLAVACSEDTVPPLPPAQQRLWEADRAAQWLLARTRLEEDREPGESDDDELDG